MRYPLVFLVEAADDICYLIMDLEDACKMGILSHK
jgi:dGTPase